MAQKGVSQPKEKYCTIYIAQNDANIPNYQDLQKQIETGKLEEKIKALKSLIICIIHDEAYPRMLMTIFNNLLPIQGESHALKKALLYYWEIIEKVNPNGNLKDEMILVCNSIRNDLLHPNEYIRGRTLRLLSRVMHKGILEPLSPSILENLSYKHTYVRRNAVSCLFSIYCSFKDELIPDVDEHIEKLLITESDLSTKRTAFLLLFTANQEKALTYLNELIASERGEEMGDIMQLIVLELLRKAIKNDPTQKSKYIKAIFYFSNSKSSSVLFECANTLISISSSGTYLKLALNIYIQLLTSNTDNNVKLIVLDKLVYIKQLNAKILEDQISEIANALNNQSLAIRQKTLDLIKDFISSKSNSLILNTLFKELGKVAQSTEGSEAEYRHLLLSTFSEFVESFPSICKELLSIIFESLFNNSKLDEPSSNSIVLILKKIAFLNEELLKIIISNFQIKLPEIQNLELIKVGIWVLGEFSTDYETTEKSINSIKIAIGSLPLEDDKLTKENPKEEDNTKKEQTAKKIRYKTIILPDGTYGTEIIKENANEIKEGSKLVQEESLLRKTLIKSTSVTGVLITALLKLIYRIRSDGAKFNKYGSEIILILCALLKLLKLDSQAKENNDLIQRLMMGIKLITNPSLFLNKKIDFLETSKQIIAPIKKQNLDISSIQKTTERHITKQADDLIIFRQLKGKSITEVDLAEEEVNELSLSLEEEEDYTRRLSRIIQLTGYSDPIYAEALMTIHKYEIIFEILLVNRENKPLQNVTVEFSTQGDSRILEKANSINLAPYQTGNLKMCVKLSSSEAGLIFASITFENSAGITQGYLITNEIVVDLIDFIYPARIEMETFRKCWSKYDWENRITMNTQLENPIDYLKLIANNLKIEILDDVSKIDNDTKFCSINCYAKTKLDDDFLLNISIEKLNNKLYGYIRIRSKIRGIVIGLGDKIKSIQRN